MEFIVRKHNKSEFYETYLQWSDDHKFPRVSDLVLPENIFVCYNDDEIPIYSIYFYHTDSKLGWLAFPISNKNVAYNKRNGGLKTLFERVVQYAKNKGYKSLITTSSTKEVISVMNEIGFIEGDINVNQYLRIL